MDPVVLTIVIVALALVFDMTNGWNDAANAVATSVSTRVLSPGVAIAFSSVLNFVGALFSSEVAQTVGRDIADPRLSSGETFLAALIIAPAWTTFCTFKGLPISCSHSLLGGLIGAVLASVGAAALEGVGLQKIVFGVFFSPIAGFLLGYTIYGVVLVVSRRWRPATASRVFGRLQIVSAGVMAFSHGTGDAQKAMGIISGALVAGGFHGLGAEGEMVIPLWVRLACAGAMAFGTAVGGWRVMRTLGMRIAHLRPHQGFAAESAAATTILVNTLSGVPISTTHSITGAILGVGSARGTRAVRWGVGGKIMFAWLVTFPVCIGGGALFYWLVSWESSV
jgi:PiT family inorganic phosphate transporter